MRGVQINSQFFNYVIQNVNDKLKPFEKGPFYTLTLSYHSWSDVDTTDESVLNLTWNLSQCHGSLAKKRCLLTRLHRDSTSPYMSCTMPQVPAMWAVFWQMGSGPPWRGCLDQGYMSPGKKNRVQYLPQSLSTPRDTNWSQLSTLDFSVILQEEVML